MPESSAHIVFVNNFSGPGLGGGEVQLMHLMRACITAGMRVALVCERGAELAGRARDLGVDVVETSLGVRSTGTAVAAIRLTAARAGIIHGTGWWTNVLVRIAGSRLPGVSVVNLVHVEPEASRFDGASRAGLLARRWADRATRREVEAYVAVSVAVAEALVRHGAQSERVHVIPNGVDLLALQAAATARIEHPLPTGEGPLVACIARLEPVKGVEHFVRAAALLANTHPDARFAVAGAGAEESRLREIAVAARMQGRFVFLSRVSPIEPLLAAAAIVVMPSLSEGMPMVALEAGALGKPVVASAVGGLREVIDNGETGILVPPADPVALAGAIGTLLHDPARAEAMGLAACERVEERFTLERMTAQYLDLYTRILS